MPYPSQVDVEQLPMQALMFVEKHGWDGWSVREFSASLGVSANALYRYIGDRENFATSIGAVACEQLQAALVAVDATGADRLVGMARAYVLFAVNRPHAFSAFVHAKPDMDDPRIANWSALWICLREAVASVLPNATEAAAFALWSQMHGRAELARGPTRMAAPDAGLSSAVLALVEGYRVLGTVASPLPERISKSV
jgi:AcrR family transcriptional regulator